ncbi:MAG: DMT family transporter [Proteobacteria bacterium]|nr:DMT family transporter [Pseudomonadota bacterium]
MNTTPSRSAATRATAIGVVALLLWASLAVLTSFTQGIPPFQLLAMSFAVAFGASLLWLGRRGRAGLAAWHQPWPVWAVGFGGIFVYHALYFYALKAAPAAQASLIAYLWPLLIVLMGSGGRPHPRALAGAALGLAGTAFMLWQRPGGEVAGAGAWAGYAAALGCALVWSAYSVANRRFADVPSDVVGAICGLVAVAGLACHLAFETTVRPSGVQALATVALGLGPVGLAFFAWDHATKHGRLATLGALSYLTPLASTLLLIALGRAEAGLYLLVPALLIVAGAVLATVGPRR